MISLSFAEFTHTILSVKNRQFKEQLWIFKKKYKNYMQRTAMILISPATKKGIFRRHVTNDDLEQPAKP